MLDQLETLQLNLIRYRKAVDGIFSPALTTSSAWRQCLLEVLVCASRLYLDYLLVMRNLPALEAVATKRRGRKSISSDVHRERRHREELRKLLESSPSWKDFKPDNAFSETTGLLSVQDYMHSLSLHLPEIYEETFQVEIHAKDFLANHSSSALVELWIGMQHLGRNHISFVLQALEWACDEGSWKAPLDRSEASGSVSRSIS